MRSVGTLPFAFRHPPSPVPLVCLASFFPLQPSVSFFPSFPFSLNKQFSSVERVRLNLYFGSRPLRESLGSFFLLLGPWQIGFMDF